MPWTSLASAVSIVFPADPEADGGQVQRRMDGLLVPRDRDIAVFLAIPLLFRVGARRVVGDAKLRLTNIVYRGRRSGSEMERLRRTCVFGKGPISDAV